MVKGFKRLRRHRGTIGGQVGNGEDERLGFVHVCCLYRFTRTIRGRLLIIHTFADKKIAMTGDAALPEMCRQTEISGDGGFPVCPAGQRGRDHFC